MVVADSSQIEDQTAAICHAWGAAVVSAPAGNVGLSRNLGAEKAKGMKGIEGCTQAMKYFSRFTKEFSFIGIQNIGNHVGEERFVQLCRHPEYLKWFKGNQELLNEARTVNAK